MKPDAKMTTCGRFATLLKTTAKDATLNDEERLERYEKMQADLTEEYESLCRQMEELKAQGLEKKATYKTLFPRKMALRDMLNSYGRYGL